MSREYSSIIPEKEKGFAASGEINPYKKEDNINREQELTGEIKTLKEEREENDKDYQTALKKIKEIQTDPNPKSSSEINLEVLNAFQKAADLNKEKNKSLDLQIDDLKDQLDKLK